MEYQEPTGEDIGETLFDLRDNEAIYLQDISRISLLKGREEEIYLAKKIREKDKSARKKFIESNLRLVVSRAAHYMKYNQRMCFLDLIQEGNIGLIRAVKKFKYELGYKFSNYAVWWIDRYIRKYLRKNSSLYDCEPTDFREAKVSQTFEQEYENIQLEEAIETVLKTLKEKEIVAIEKHFLKGMKNEKIGDLLKVTKQRVGQIQKKALEKLRHSSRAKILKPFYDNLE